MEIDLGKVAGLPISFDENNLKFNVDFPFIKKSERNLKGLKPYLKNQNFIIKKPYPIYTVWRHAYLKKDDKKIKDADLRYDITLIPPGKIGDEFVKTAGHYHLPYPEVYEVLYGRAYFLIQSEKSVFLAEAGPGEKFLIPPGYGHNTINVFNKSLLLANWMSDKADYDYEPYKIHRGAMYYFLADGDLIDIIKNPNYPFVPEIKKVKIKEYPEFGLIKNKPLYSLVNNIDKLRFLNHPEKFKGEWRNW